MGFSKRLTKNTVNTDYASYAPNYGSLYLQTPAGPRLSQSDDSSGEMSSTMTLDVNPDNFYQDFVDPDTVVEPTRPSRGLEAREKFQALQSYLEMKRLEKLRVLTNNVMSGTQLSLTKTLSSIPEKKDNPSEETVESAGYMKSTKGNPAAEPARESLVWI